MQSDVHDEYTIIYKKFIRCSCTFEVCFALDIFALGLCKYSAEMV